MHHPASTVVGTGVTQKRMRTLYFLPCIFAIYSKRLTELTTQILVETST